MKKKISPGKVKHVYEKGYASMDKLEGDLRLKKVLDITQNLHMKEVKNILDIGCGDGYYTLELNNILQAKNIYGIDISAAAVKQAKKNGITAEVLDIDEKDLPYKNNFFDYVYCGSLIELVLNADHLLTEIHRVLKPTGHLVISFPNIAAWASRISLSLGYLPFYSRLSTQYDLGKIDGAIKKGQSTGFIRLFTLHAFKHLAKQYKLRAVSVAGAPEKALPFPLRFIDKIMSKKPSLAFQVICVMQKS